MGYELSEIWVVLVQKTYPFHYAISLIFNYFSLFNFIINKIDMIFQYKLNGSNRKNAMLSLLSHL